MHCTTAFRDFGFLRWQRLTSCAFEPVCHHIQHRFGSKETSFMSSSCFSAPVCHLLPSCIAALCFCLSVCLLTKQLLAWWSFLLPETSQTCNQRMQETDPPWLLMIVSQNMNKTLKCRALKKMCWDRMFFLAHEWEHVGQWWIAC
jgi:hypothetical protein